MPCRAPHADARPHPAEGLGKWLSSSVQGHRACVFQFLHRTSPNLRLCPVTEMSCDCPVDFKGNLTSAHT
jgi:hypothetical protein